MLDIETSNNIAKDIVLRINEHAAKTLNDGHRRHLGGSIIGEPCSRKLWYGFRWFAKPFSNEEPNVVGQKMRLFNRGHREEPVFIEWLKAIGFTFEQTSEEQLRIADCNDHFGGSLDNTGYAPPQYNLPDRIFYEFKTIANKYFKELVKDGVRHAQPKHWSQICVYGHKAQIKYCLYISVNKDTDELYVELVEVDDEMGALLIRKAESIIRSETPPQKISMVPTHFSCKWCQFQQICHYNAPAEINCRSCTNAIPVADGKWHCRLYNLEIPDHVIPVGCPQHKEIW